MPTKNENELRAIIQNKNFTTINLQDYLRALLLEKGLEKKEVVKKSNISTNYVYQIFNGRRQPQRNKVIMLAFGMDLDLNETLDLLKVAEVALLYDTNKRDLVIMHCIKTKKSVIECNIILNESEVNILD